MDERLSREEQLDLVAALRARLYGDTGAPDADVGVCGECGAAVYARFRVGRFLLCRACAGRRQRAAERVYGHDHRNGRSTQ